MVANAKGSLERFQREPKSIDIIRPNVYKCMPKMNQWASVRLSNEEERLHICKGRTVYSLYSINYKIMTMSVFPPM